MNTQNLYPSLNMGIYPELAQFTLTRLSKEFRGRGAAVLGPPALDYIIYTVLLNEAIKQRQDASWNLVAEQCPGEISQNNQRAYLGQYAKSFLSSPTVLAYMEQITKHQLIPSWSASCYTYYDGPGQHMGEHCDKWKDCRIAMLIYLNSTWVSNDQPSEGLQLQVFHGNNSESGLSLRITALSNRIVFLNGAEQAHLRPPLAKGEHLTMLAGCYQLASSV